MRPFEFLREPDGDSFDLLLGFSREHCPVFSVSEHEIMGWDAFVPFGLDGDQRDEWRKRSGVGPQELRAFFRVTDESMALLRDVGGLYRCPDDLAMHAPDGKTFFWCIAHEGERGCDPTVFDEAVVRPLLSELHRMGVAPDPDVKRRVASLALPGRSLNELREMFLKGTSRIGEPGGPQVTEENISELQEEMTRFNALSDFWGRRFAVGEVPGEEDFREAAAAGFDLGLVVGGAASTGMLDRDQAEALLEITSDRWARGQLIGFLWLERVRDWAKQSGQDAEEAKLLDELPGLLDVPVNQRSVESIYDPGGSGLSSLLFQVLPIISRTGLERVERIAREHPCISEHIRKQLGPAIERRRQARS